MLGKRSRLLLGIIGKRSFAHAENFERKTVDDQAPDKQLLLEHANLGCDRETKSFDSCESPRSVLDVSVRTSEKHLHSRSFRSHVPILRLRNRGSHGVGLAIIADIQAEEQFYGTRPDSGHDHASTCQLQSCIGPNHQHIQRSQPIPITINCGIQRQKSSYNCTAVKESSLTNSDDDDDDNDDDNLNAENGNSSSLFDSMEFFGLDNMSPWQRKISLTKPDSDTYRGECIIRPSIFTVGSIPSSYGKSGALDMKFLEACAHCHRALGPEKEIFMYRGDQAFCSKECRGERIGRDEFKEKLMITMYT
ncbi:hypothetical protein KP509_08G050800 [Ceratopteris richardii]|uniref:FLZ-type domain-containing protein n=1 Tax=Ceratopteris richardii TaxID=49495 RepID=A0A8T2UCD4_CERRI|nr:hypothetical protein KP509_08G050800 [Ceratopteris richardii]